MRILIFGGNGMLGHKLIREFRESFEVWATLKGHFSEVDSFGIFDRDRTIAGVDATDAESVRRAVTEVRPDVVVNAVGIVKQKPASEDVQLTLSINSVFPRRLASLADEFGFKLITISTDCVFRGDRGNYNETDVPDATDLYGLSKFLGEVTTANCLTIRTSIIGRELATAHSIVEWFLSQRGKSVQGYTNAIYTGFPTIILANIIKSIIVDNPSMNGLYHVSADPISKFELLNLIDQTYRTGVEIKPFDDYKIDRSLNSTKFRQETGFSPLGWPEMIALMAADPTPYDNWRSFRSATIN
jgi:dTDP-4-dehydrorhamnose reductase